MFVHLLDLIGGIGGQRRFTAPAVVDDVYIIYDRLLEYCSSLSVGAQPRKVTFAIVWSDAIIIKAGIVSDAAHAKRIAVGADDRRDMGAMIIAFVSYATGVIAKICALNAVA